jgi:thioredoxin reductase
MYDLIVVGGGPAGMAAAAQAIRKRLNVLMVSGDLGGQTNHRMSLPWIRESPSVRGIEVVQKLRGELEYLGFARRTERVERICRIEDAFSVTTDDGDELFTRALVLATGARKERLDVPGEKEFHLRGLSYSAITHAPLFADRTAVVAGDGDLALRAAAELATIARRIYLICRNDDLYDYPLGIKLYTAENATILEGYRVVSIQGDEFVRSVSLIDPTGQPTEIHTDGIFVEKALLPNSSIAANLVMLDGQGRVKIDCANRTNIPGVYAAGDVTSNYAEQVLIAVGEGAKAAMSAYDYLLPLL